MKQYRNPIAVISYAEESDILTLSDSDLTLPDDCVLHARIFDFP